MEEWALIEKTGCNAVELQRDLPLDTRYRYLSAMSVMEKAKPALEALAKQKGREEG